VDARQRLGRLAVYALVLGAAAAARATTFVALDDTALARRSTAVVFGRVTAVSAVEDRSNQGVWTQVTILPDTVVAGSLPDGPLLLREPGGDLPDHSEHVIGAATYAVGERVLVFLRRQRDGSLTTTSLGLGKYVVEAGPDGQRRATRRLEEGVALFDPQSRSLRHDLAPTSRLLDDVVAEVHSAFSAAGLPVRLPAPEDPDQLEQYQAPFALLGQARWFEPDSGTPVSYLVDSTGTPSLGSVASRSAIDAALAAWTAVPSSALVLQDGGTTAPAAFGGCGGVNRLVFNDPFGDIEDPQGCSGILALGGFCTSGEQTVFNGTTFVRITHAKVTFNNGWEACGLWNACDLAEVATHEIGHTIGLDHSSDGSATMAPYAHFDGRCAGLGADDVAAVSFVYGTPVSDQVVVPRAPVHIRIGKAQSQAQSVFAATVRDAISKKMGVTHTVRLVASDGDCPVGTVGTPDFDKRTPGAQDTVDLKAGAKRGARVPITVDGSTFSTPNVVAPHRCTLHLTLEAVDSVSSDANPANNVVDVVLDMVDPADDDGDPSRHMRDTVLDGINPIHVSLRRGTLTKSIKVGFRVRNADIGTFPDHTVHLTPGDGDCPAGTLGAVDLASLAGDQASVDIPRGKKRKGKLTLTVNAAAFEATSSKSPARCTATLTADPLAGETDLTNNTVPIVIDVTDGNDY
jgi:hypothetical protein